MTVVTVVTLVTVGAGGRGDGDGGGSGGGAHSNGYASQSAVWEICLNIKHFSFVKREALIEMLISNHE